MNNDELLQAGIAAIRAGDLLRAQALLSQLIQADPRSEAGWLWLGQSQIAPDRREYCFRRVLSLNPNNVEAKRFLETDRRLSAPPSAQAATGPTAVRPDERSSKTLSVANGENGVVVGHGDAGAKERPLTEKLPTQPPAPLAPPVSAAPASAIPSGTVESLISQPAQPGNSFASSKPAFGLNKILIALAGLFVGVILCGAPLTCAVVSGRLDRFIQMVLRPPTRTPEAAPISMPTFPPTWTPRPGAASPVGTPSPLFSQRLDEVKDDIAHGRSLMQAEQYAEAVTVWDQVLTRVPEYADGYYQRGQSYQGLLSNQRFESEYLDYLTHALADFNEAVRLDPGVGDYYFARHQVEDRLAGEAFYRVDQDFWDTQALEDIRKANQLGTHDELAERDPGFLLVTLGRCEEALAEFNQLIEASPEPSAGLTTGLADSYRCQGKLDLALQAIDTALELYPSFERKLDRAIILYNLGLLDQALDQINETIEDSPYYCGCRYYLRALIYYDQGKPDLAQADIDFGTGQTWGRGGVRDYVLGRLALDAGDQEQGIALLQEAEASLLREYGPLLGRIQKDLAELNAEPLSPRVSVPPTPTLLPITPQVQPPTLTPVPLNQPANISATPVPYTGMGAFTLNPGDQPVFHFQPLPLFSGKTIYRVDYHLEGGLDSEASGIDLYLWRPADNQWLYIPLNWGVNSTRDGPDFVTKTGDIYLYLVNTTDQPVAINNLSVILTVLP